MRLRPIIVALTIVMPFSLRAHVPAQQAPPPPTEQQIKAAAALPFRDP